MDNFKAKLNNFFALDEEEEIDEMEQGSTHAESNQKHVVPTPTIKAETPEVENRVLRKSGGENVVAINQKQAIQKPQITIIEPRLYSEVQEVSDYVLSNQTVIINFRRMDHEQATKMIDFLMGVAYAIKGDIQRLDEEIFICTPQSVTINGSELSEYANSLL